MYEVHIAGQFVEGQFIGLKEQNGVNTATVTVGPWPKK